MPVRQQQLPLHRRRGATTAGGSSSPRGASFLIRLFGKQRHPFRFSMFVLLVIAILLCTGLLSLVMLTTTDPESSAEGAAVGHKVLSVQKLLRGPKVQQVKAGIGRAVQRAEQAAERALDRAHIRLPHHKGAAGPAAAAGGAAAGGAAGGAGGAAAGGAGGGAAAGPDGVPTVEYPYSLEAVPADYDIPGGYSPAGGSRYAEYAAGGTPWSITAEIRAASDEQARSRRVHVKRAVEHAWTGYAKYAFGRDEVQPQTARGHDNWGGQGITLVDALDTLWLTGMRDEFWRARDWVRDELNHEGVGSVSVFETTIRDLGGLLAAYDWSGDAAFETKALDLGERLLRAYDGSSTGIPYGMVNLKTGATNNIGWAGGNAILAEFGTTQIENRYLSKISGLSKFAAKTEHVFEILRDMSPASGLFPYYVRNNFRNGATKPEFANDKLTFGAMADSVYEYMLKIWIQGGKTEPMYREMYDKAIDGMHAELLQRSTPSGLTYIADKNGKSMDHKMDHLVCFMGGLLALGAYTDPAGLDGPRAVRDLQTARALTYTCYQMYARMNTGISPEFIQFYPGKDFQIGRGAPHYLLRPEAVESFFVLNHLTGDPVYREWGWEVFQSIEKYCKTAVAYGALSNVQDTSGKPRDQMESFFLAETLKYMYLLQDPDTEIDLLHKHVFNTEAHPLRIFPVMDQDKAAAAAAARK